VFEQLMTLLRHPEPAAWKHLAGATALAPASTGTTIPIESHQNAVDQAAIGSAVAPAPNPTDIAAIGWTSQNGLAVTAILDRNGEPTPTVVTSFDTGGEPDKPRWFDWLRLGNLFQFLEAQAVITTTRSHLAAAPTPAAKKPDVSTPAELEALLQDVFDEAAVPLARAAAASGFTDLVVGYSAGDPDDSVIEIAWPDERVGILPSGGAVPEGLDDWDLRTPDDWTTKDLTDVLTARTA
jgi:hypothetical protein